MTAREIQQFKWRLSQRQRRERMYRARGPLPLAQTPRAIYMRGYRRGIRKRVGT